jgi:outer membrane receptor for Fe3+-dicitrate
MQPVVVGETMDPRNRVSFVATNYGEATLTYLVYSDQVVVYGNVTEGFIPIPLDKKFKPMYTDNIEGKAEFIEYGDRFSMIRTANGTYMTGYSNF